MQESPITTHIPSTFMSKDSIINSFIVAYNELKEFMASEMVNLKGELISCDHAFKLVSHVGIYHSGKWVPQYNMTHCS